MKPLEEISVAAADPDTLAIYHQLMTAAGSGSPALIFRHMAVTPGLLDWVWQAVGDDVIAGWVRDAVLDIVSATPPVPIDPITPAVLTETGIDADARRVIGDMLLSYNRMNPLNLILIGAARKLISDTILQIPARLSPKPVTAAPSAPPALPPPPQVSALEPALQDAIRGLCKYLPDVGGEVTPTLYRHFGIWPRFMLVVAQRLTAQLDELDRATHALNQACEPLILELAGRAKARIDSPPPVADVAQLITTFDGFGYVIPHLIVIGRSLDAAIFQK